jgi:phosphoenolpyruvate carboxylase
VRALYAEWPAFHALIDNAQLALVRSDIEVAEQYARLADPDARTLFDLVKAEHARTVARILEVTGGEALLGGFPTVRRSVERRNPYVDVLSHVQIELLRRMPVDPDPDRVREILFVTINGIAAGLQTAG